MILPVPYRHLSILQPETTFQKCSLNYHSSAQTFTWVSRIKSKVLTMASEVPIFLLHLTPYPAWISSLHIFPPVCSALASDLLAVPQIYQVTRISGPTVLFLHNFLWLIKTEKDIEVLLTTPPKIAPLVPNSLSMALFFFITFYSLILYMLSPSEKYEGHEGRAFHFYTHK